MLRIIRRFLQYQVLIEGYCGYTARVQFVPHGSGFAGASGNHSQKTWYTELDRREGEPVHHMPTMLAGLLLTNPRGCSGRPCQRSGGQSET